MTDLSTVEVATKYVDGHAQQFSRVYVGGRARQTAARPQIGMVRWTTRPYINQQRLRSDVARLSRSNEKTVVEEEVAAVSADFIAAALASVIAAVVVGAAVILSTLPGYASGSQSWGAAALVVCGLSAYRASTIAQRR